MLNGIRPKAGAAFSERKLQLIVAFEDKMSTYSCPFVYSEQLPGESVPKVYALVIVTMKLL